MKRIVPALAAVILGSGCVVTTEPCDGTVTVSWNYFQDADNNFWSSCFMAGVQNVDVYVDGTRNRVPCSSYGTVISLGEGTHSVVVEGVASDETILYRASYPTTSVACGFDTPVDSTPAEGHVDLYSSFASGSCNTYSPSYLWFSIVDWATNAPTPESTYSQGASYATCSYASGLRMHLPAGSYTIQGVEEDYYSAGYWYVARHDCMGQNFTVAGGTATTLDAYLVTSSSTCF